MEFRVLGPVEIRDGDRLVRLGTPRIRAVAAILLARRGELVSIDGFIDELWPERPPDTCRALVHGYVSRLRRGLTGPTARDRLVTRKPGYLLRVADEELDQCRLELLVAEARAARRAGQPQRCGALLSEAQTLWRGAPYADVPATPTVRAAAAALTEQRLASVVEQYDVTLALGQHAEAVAGLSALVAEYPLQERLAGQLMLALYRSGRQDDALAVYRQTRGRLRDDLGVEPGAELHQLHQRILAGEIVPQVVTADEPRHATAAGAPGGRSTGPGRDGPGTAADGQPALPVPRQLPADLAGFTGRCTELAAGLNLSAGTDPGGIQLCAIDGMAGVGKTTLVVHWAHRIADRFPDGQLHANLRGFDPGGAATPEEVLRDFLEALGVPPQRVPTGATAQANLYRSMLAGRRVLVLLDNARNAEQVRPLLPGTEGCLVLVTSRNRLSGLLAADGARSVSLGPLPTDDARRLLASRIGPDRVAAEPAAVNEIVARCGRLPLALAIVAARAAINPTFALHALADELGEAGGDLDVFGDGDAATDLRTMFSWSYQALGEDAALMFRALGVHPGPDIGLAAAASIAGVPARRARAMLAELVRAHLLTEPVPGRYAMHDLLRCYAAELAAGNPVRQRCEARMLDHYLHTAFRAARQLNPAREAITLTAPQPGVGVDRVDDRQQAMAWFGVEHLVLLAVTRQAAASGFDTHTWQMIWALNDFFDWRGEWHSWTTVEPAILAVAPRLTDPTEQMLAHRGLARAYARLARYHDARSRYEYLLDLHTQRGDRAGAAEVHRCLGWVFEQIGEYRPALGHTWQGHVLLRELGNEVGQARALNAVGWCHALLGEYRKALACCRPALEALRDVDDRYGQAATWDSIGYANHHLGRFDEATAAYRESLALYRELGDRYDEAGTLTRAGDAHRDAGDQVAARRAWRESLEILVALGHPDAAEVRARLRPRAPRSSTDPLPAEGVS